MDSKKNDDMLRAALQRRIERLTPASGWEERVFAGTAPKKRSRPVLLWWTALSAAAAAVIFAVFTPEVPRNSMVAPMTEKAQLVQGTVCDTPTNAVAETKEETILVAATMAPHYPAKKVTNTEVVHPVEPIVIVPELEIEESMTVEQEIMALLAMADADDEMANSFSDYFNDMNPIIITNEIEE